jgi:hypothetical protein
MGNSQLNEKAFSQSEILISEFSRTSGICRCHDIGNELEVVMDRPVAVNDIFSVYDEKSKMPFWRGPWSCDCLCIKEFFLFVSFPFCA